MSKRNIQGCNLSDFEQEFRQYLTAVIKLRPSSVKNYVSDFRYFAGWVSQEKVDSIDSLDLLTKITPDVINDYKKYLSKGKMPRRTINRRLSSLRRFFTFAISQGWVVSNPARKIPNVAKSTSSLLQKPLLGSRSSLDSFATHLRTQGENANLRKKCMNDLAEFFAIISSSA